MTKDEALTMIVASIAMEELALSHIVNAEGEKLQYILGTLPGRHGSCASLQEILAVNKSVKELLDTVMQSQMLLKGKLERALEAGGHACVPAPEPPCPWGPPCPEEPSCPCGPSRPEKPPCPCGPPRPEQPPCSGSPCRPKSMIQLTGRCNGLCWDNGSLMFWKCRDQRGCDIRWSEKNPALVSLNPRKTYALNYTMNVRDPYPGGSAGVIFVRIAPCGAFSGVLPFCFSVNSTDHKPLTLHYTTTLFPQDCPAPCADLSLVLNYRDRLLVEQASLSIAEV